MANEEVRSVVVRLSAEAADYLRTMQQAGVVGSDAMTKVEASTQRSSAALDNVGRTAGRVALVAGAGLVAMAASTAKFDKQMSAVQAATHETEQNMSALRTAALEAGADTAFSATEAAQGIEELAKAGIGAEDVLSGGLRGSLDLAAAGNLSVAESAEIAASAMTQFDLKGNQVAHVADLLAAGAGKAQGSVHDLGMALNQSGLVASQTGLSIEETTTALAAFASAGLTGSDAGTSFKTMLLALTPQSAEAADEMERIGFSAFDAQGQFIGLEAMAGRLQESLRGMSEEQRNATLQTIFGRDAIRAANVLFEQGAEGIDEWAGKVNDAGYAAETAETRLDNLSGDIEKFTGALETALIGAGDGSTGILREMVQGATAAVDAFNSLPGPVKNVASALLAITAVTGGGLWLGSKVVRAIDDTRTALTHLSPAAATATGKLARIGATAGVVLAAAQAMGALVNATMDLGNVVDAADIPRDIEAIAGGKSKDSLDALTGALEGVNEAGAGTVNALFAIPSALTGIDTSFKTNTDTIESFDQQLAALVEGGNAEQAAAAFAAIRDAAAEAGGVSDKDVVKSFDAYATALDNVATEAEGAAGATDEVTAAEAAAGAETKRLAKELKAAKGAYAEARKEAKETANSFFGVGESVDDAKVSLNQWIDQMVKQAIALEQFTANAERAANKGLRQGLIDALEEAGPAGALRMRQLANATEDEIAKANRAWDRGQRAVDDYVDSTTKVPGNKVTRLTVESTDAMAKLTVLGTKLDHIQSKTITVRVNHMETRLERAGGGLVVGPGTGTSDDVVIAASNGEYVMRAAAVRKYGVAFMANVNAERFASGGLVGSASGRVAQGDDEVLTKFARAIAKALRGFDVKPGEGADAARSEVRELREAVREAGGEWTRALDLQSQKLIRQAKDYDALSEQLGASTDALEQLQQAQAAYAQQVSQVFSQSSFGNGLAGFDLQTAANTNDSRDFQTTLEQLVAQGLDGELFKQLASSGDLTTAMQLLATGPAGIALREQAFAAMLAAQQSLGGFAGQQVFGADVAAAQAVVDRNARAVEKLEGQMVRVEDALERHVSAVDKLPEKTKAGAREGSEAGTRAGMRDRDRDGAQRVRSGL